VPVVVLFGAAGQVGREIAERAPAGLGVRALARADADITDPAQVEAALAAHAPALAINVAAYTAVDRAEGGGRDAAWAANAEGPAILAAACARRACPLIHLSTDYVFDGAADRPYDEDSVPRPLSVYGASKLAGEAAIRARLPAHIILRVAWVFGRHGGNFVETMLRLAAGHDAISVVDDQRGGPTPADSIADAVLAIAVRLVTAPLDEGPWGTYHFCGAPTVSRYAFAEAIFAEAVRAGRIAVAPRLVAVGGDHFPTPARRPAQTALACRRLAERFGILQPDWRAGLARYMAGAGREDA
jgi:dTDP-4-dehydrorhamnose reductase